MARIYLTTSESEDKDMRKISKILNMSVSSTAKELAFVFNSEDIIKIKEQAEQEGKSLTEYIRYSLRLPIEERKESDIISLSKKMIDYIESLESKSVFIVSSTLIEEWPSLNTHDKRALSHRLKKYIVENPNRFKVNKKLDGRLNQYVKL